MAGTAIDYTRGLDFEQVWAMFQETDRQQKETEKRFQETDRKFQETGRRLKEIREEIKEDLKELSRQLGGLGNAIGTLIETLIAARLWEKFAAYNLQRAYRRIPVYNENNKALTEIDILLSNTEWVMAVEVKREAEIRDIDHHLKRMELIKKYPPAEVIGKKLLGAISGGIVPPDTQMYAHQAGFFVLELKGEAVELIKPPNGFSPKVW